MKKQSRETPRRRRVETRDRQVEEFERRDLGDDIRGAGVAKMLRRSTKPTSILLEPDLIETLRRKGAKRGLGYQTMLKLVVREHLDEY
jgi:predicted DNA binding CopG/RHH family protein